MFAVCPPAADLVSGVPHHLCVVADLVQAVVGGPVAEHVFLQEPALDGEVPVGEGRFGTLRKGRERDETE